MKKKMIRVREGGEALKVEIALLGITKAALATDSFLISSILPRNNKSFTDAAIKGKDRSTCWIKGKCYNR